MLETYISNETKVPDNRGDGDHVGEGDENGALGPAEVLVAVRYHVYVSSSVPNPIQSIYHPQVFPFRARRPQACPRP